VSQTKVHAAEPTPYCDVPARIRIKGIRDAPAAGERKAFYQKHVAGVISEIALHLLAANPEMSLEEKKHTLGGNKIAGGK
jgi:hypothetical protein